MNYLVATNDTAFLNESNSIISKNLPQIKHIQDVFDQSGILQKIAKGKYEYLLIDLNSCPIDTPFFLKLAKLRKTKVKIVSVNHADFPIDFFNLKSIQLFSMNYQFMSRELNKFISNDNDYLWGEEIQQLNLYEKEILCNIGSIGDAIYLIKEGSLQREFPDGSVLDGSIGPGKMVGELAYFNREPRKWKIVAAEDCTLVRISYKKVDKQLTNQPGWIKVMFTTLADRSLKYAKSS